MLQRGFSAIPALLSGQLGNSNLATNPDSNNFISFFNKFAHLTSKNEEKDLITKEIKYLKHRLSQPNLSLNVKRECLIELLYCHLLGYDVSFAYIHAINLAQQGALITKRTGYLLCSLFFDNKHELALLLVNTILKDLQSSNLATVSTALISCGHMINKDTVSTIVDVVLKKTNYPKEIIRKKSLHCLLSLVDKYPDIANQIMPHLHDRIHDNDPGVVSVVIEIYIILCKSDVTAYRNTIQPLIDVLSQLVDLKISEIHNYNGIQCLWLQISIIKLLTLLSLQSSDSKHLVFPILKKVLTKTSSKYRAGLSVMYEALTSIIKLSNGHSEDITMCSEFVDTFIHSKQSNIKLAGVKILSQLISKSNQIALTYQSTILDCLDSEDDTIQSATLDLLYCMANPINKDVVCKKLLGHADLIKNKSEDVQMQRRESIYRNVIGIICRFSSQDPLWYVDKVFSILESLSSSSSSSFSSHHLVEMVTTRFMEFLNEDILKCEIPPSPTTLKVIEKSLKHIESYDIDESNANLTNLTVWVLGKYAYLNPRINIDDLFSILIGLFYSTNDISIKQMCLFSLVNSFTKLTNKNEGLNNLSQLKDAIGSKDKLLLQQYKELMWLCSNDNDGHLIEKINNQKQFDYTLSFLDEYTCSSLERGGAVYYPPTNQQQATKLINIHEMKEKKDVNSKIDSSKNFKVDMGNLIEPLDIEDVSNDGAGGWTLSGYKEY